MLCQFTIRNYKSIREKLDFYMQATAVMDARMNCIGCCNIWDAKIHLVLRRCVVVLYNNMRINKNGAQLFFISHDLSIMNHDEFRRDEIRFAAKGDLI